MDVHATTILAIRHKGSVCIAGDGQVTLSSTVLKHSAKKIRRIYQDKVLAGFSGSTADAFTLFEKFEKKLEQYHGNLTLVWNDQIDLCPDALYLQATHQRPEDVFLAMKHETVRA